MTAFFNDRPFREASHLNGFSGNRIERFSEGRDEASVARALVSTDVGFFLFAGERPLVQTEGDRPTAIFSTAEAIAEAVDDDTFVLLGVTPDGPRFAGLLQERVGPDAFPNAVDLRSLATDGTLPFDELAALAHARSYLFWHDANRFCGRCGGALKSIRGGVSRVCEPCGHEVFPRVDPVVIMLAIDGDQCLLGRQPRFVPGMYSALAGFLEPGETIEEAVRREIQEEAGIRTVRVHYHSSQAWPFPSSLMIGCHAEAATTDLTPDAAELEDCRWFAREEVRLMLARTHPQALMTPPPMAIAHQLIKAFVEY